MASFHTRHKIQLLRERRRSEDMQAEKKIVYDKAMSTYERAYHALYGVRPHVKENKGYFYVAGKGRFTRAQLLKRASEMDAQLHAQQLQGDERDEERQSVDSDREDDGAATRNSQQ